METVPVGDWLLQVLTLGEPVPHQVVSGALGGGVVVDGGMREEKAGEPAGLPLYDRDGLPRLPPVITHRL